MWENIIGRVPSGFILFCAGLSFLIPFLIYKINTIFHKHGDPPWKKKE